MLLVLTLILTCIGIWMVFDASIANLVQNHKFESKFMQQVAIAFVGVVGMLLISRWDYRNLAKFAVPFLLTVGVLLIAVLVVGKSANGAKRWIGPIQPSEFAKLAIVLFIAHVCAGRPKLMRDFTAGPLLPLIAIAATAFFVNREPDLGTTLVIVGAGFASLFFAGMRVSHIVAAMACGVLVLGASMAAKMDIGGAKANPVTSTASTGSGNYRNDRIQVWLHPDKYKTGAGYQVYHSMIAVGSGGILGMGAGKGRQKYYIPEAHTDFIFATFAEEGGLIAVLIMIALYIFLVGRAMHIATTTQDPFGAILAGGIGAIFGVQTLLNLGVVSAAIPDTGVPLPFVSYGGSSLLVSLFCVGILLSIYRYSDRDLLTITKQAVVEERDFERKWNRTLSHGPRQSRRP